MMLYRLLFILLITLLPLDTQAQIYICVDENGQRHYSDKRCPSKKMKQTSSINNKGQERAPENVQIFTSAIQLLKRSFALMTIYEPNNLEYSELYNLITSAELRHMRFMTNPIPNRYQNYTPFSKGTKDRIISSMSSACRQRGYFSVCAAVEGNPWIGQHELSYYRGDYQEKYSQSPTGEFCDKAIDARAAGVISDNLMTYFCQ